MRRLIMMVLCVAFVLTGCSVNPVTGEKNFVLPNLNEDWERKVGQDSYAPMRQAEGGDYQLDPALTEYVASVGKRLAAQSKRDLPYEFRVINDTVPNAWALPGGKIVVNRGLLTELNSEAELAAVLGHEIVHADAAHGARAQSKGMLTTVGMMAAMVYGSSKADSQMGSQIAMLVPMVGAQLITTKYGRDAERESDLYGMRYMSAAGYDPQGAVELQETFVRLSAERSGNWLTGLFATHPPSTERVANNRATARTLPAGGETGRDIYLRKTAYIRETKPAYLAYEKARKALAEDNAREARAQLTKALQIEPREAIFHALSGDIHAYDNDYRNAERAYSEALRLDGGYFYHFLRRGQTRYEQKNYSAARTDLERSLKLLETEQAYYLLGNMDRLAGNLDSAVKYYQAAARSDSPVSAKARYELVLIDLPNNPGKYIQTQTVLGKNGKVDVVVRNNAPLPVQNVKLKVEYINARGNVRESTQNLGQQLAAGQQTTQRTGVDDIYDVNEMARRVRVTVVGARVAEK